MLSYILTDYPLLIYVVCTVVGYLVGRYLERNYWVYKGRSVYPSPIYVKGTQYYVVPDYDYHAEARVNYSSNN
jgi:hypothetical protein